MLAPIGNLNQGIELDGFIAGQFEKWFSGYNPNNGPFATTVSLINPHDIKNYPVDTLQDRLTTRDHFIGSKPPNYEDLATLEKNKPSLQQDEESIHLPLLVYDPTGRWTRTEKTPRQQFTSTVDLSPLFLTLATGGQSWLRDPRFNFLSNRVDWESLLQSPYGKGREYIISTSDEFFGDEFDPVGTLAPADAPFHVIGIRTRERKFATYNYWTVGSIALNYSARQENELYDYSTNAGRLELENLAGRQPALFAQLQQFIQNEILPYHLRRQLPDPYQAVHEAAIQAYINGIQEPNSIEQG